MLVPVAILLHIKVQCQGTSETKNFLKQNVAKTYTNKTLRGLYMH